MFGYGILELCGFASCEMTKWKIGAVCGTALLIAAAVVVA